MDESQQPEDIEIEKIVTGEVTIRKPSRWKKFRQSFIAGDATSVGEHVFWNLMLPAAQDALADMGRTFIEMMIFGDRRSRFGNPRTPVSGPGSTSRINYGGMSNGGQRIVLTPNQNNISQEPTHVRFNPNEIIVSSRSEAETIINKMVEVIEKYNSVSVAHLYSMVGVSADYMDHKWGWTNLNHADVRRVNGGVLLVLPRPQDLN